MLVPCSRRDSALSRELKSQSCRKCPAGAGTPLSAESSTKTLPSNGTSCSIVSRIRHRRSAKGRPSQKHAAIHSGTSGKTILRWSEIAMTNSMQGFGSNMHPPKLLVIASNNVRAMCQSPRLLVIACNKDLDFRNQCHQNYL